MLHLSVSVLSKTTDIITFHVSPRRELEQRISLSFKVGQQTHMDLLL